MGNLVWEDSDKWPVCGEGIRKKGKGEKREDNTKGMLFLEAHSKEETDHVTAMVNTTCIFHKNRGNQHYDSLHRVIPPVFGQRGSEGQGWLFICVSWTVTSLLLPLSYDLPRKWWNIPVAISPQHSLPPKMAFFPVSLLKTGHKPTLRLHNTQAALLCSSPSQGRGVSAASPWNRGQAWLQLRGRGRAMRRCRKQLCQAIMPQQGA